MKTVFVMLKNKYEKTCNEDDGIILSIDEIKNVENMISKDSCYIIFNITFLATVIKPEKGVKLVIKPSMISSKGIFGKIYDNINIFVPESNFKDLKDWKFSNDSYTNSKNGRIVNKESTVDIVITDIKFNSTKYNCVCSMI
jgi:DNA-directed RNA polymerase subunit E'/Rpb7